MRKSITWFREVYGANPLQLLSLLACFALAGYALLQFVTDPSLPLIAIWFLAAVIAHDLVLFPLYALADRSTAAALSAIRPRHRSGSVVPPLNYLRLPTLAAGLLFLVFFPGIVQQGSATYLAATGQTQAPFLTRWLLITAVLFGGSALVYAWRQRRATAPARALRRSSRSVVRSGERVLAFAERADGELGAVASARALYYRDTESGDTWTSIGWNAVADTVWQQEQGALIVSIPPGIPPAHAPAQAVVPLKDPGELPEVTRALGKSAGLAAPDRGDRNH